jgi:hypothetical protein
VVLDVLVVLYGWKHVNIIPKFKSLFSRETLTQVEVIINGIGDTANEEDGMDHRSSRGVLAIKVASLVATNETAGLGRFCGTLGQFLSL